MRTRRQLIEAALRTLRVIAAGETIDSDDFADVTEAYQGLHANLRDRGIAYWPNTGADVEEIPEPVFRGLSMVLAVECADAYGKKPPLAFDDDGRQTGADVVGMRMLRRHVAKRPSGEPTPFSSY